MSDKYRDLASNMVSPSWDTSKGSSVPLSSSASKSVKTGGAEETQQLVLQLNPESALLHSGLSEEVVAQKILPFLNPRSIRQLSKVQSIEKRFGFMKYCCKEHGTKLEHGPNQQEGLPACEDCKQEKGQKKRCDDCNLFVETPQWTFVGDFGDEEEFAAVLQCETCERNECLTCAIKSACSGRNCKKHCCGKQGCPSMLRSSTCCSRPFCVDCHSGKFSTCNNCGKKSCTNCPSVKTLTCGRCSGSFCFHAGKACSGFTLCDKGNDFVDCFEHCDDSGFCDPCVKSGALKACQCTLCDCEKKCCQICVNVCQHPSCSDSFCRSCLVSCGVGRTCRWCDKSWCLDHQEACHWCERDGGGLFCCFECKDPNFPCDGCRS